MHFSEIHSVVRLLRNKMAIERNPFNVEESWLLRKIVNSIEMVELLSGSPVSQQQILLEIIFLINFGRSIIVTLFAPLIILDDFEKIQ